MTAACVLIGVHRRTMERWKKRHVALEEKTWSIVREDTVLAVFNFACWEFDPSRDLVGH